MIGPLLGGIIADYYHMNYLFMIIISLLTIGIFTTLIYDRKLKYPAKTEEITVHS